MDGAGKGWSYEVVRDLALRMQRRKDKGFRVGPGTAQLVVDALFAFAAERLRGGDRGFDVDVWTPDDTRLHLRFANTTDLATAHAAYEAAAARYPDQPVTLRHGIRVMRQVGPARRPAQGDVPSTNE